MADRRMEDNLVQFVGVTGTSTRDARKFLEKYKRVDVAIDAYYNNPHEFSVPTRHQPALTAPSTSKLTTLFNKYKDPDGDEITVDGTIKLCSDLEVDPEDVVLLAVAFELKSPGIGCWTKQGWTEGWKALGVDSIPAMKGILQKLTTKLSNDPDYFRKVYNHTFEFGRSDGQRSLGIESAQAFWGLLLPHGLKGPALSHINAESSDGDVSMEYEEGWRPEYIEWWFDYLNDKGGKSVSRDTWVMFLDFLRSIDSRFENYNPEGRVDLILESTRVLMQAPQRHGLQL
ncbi:hypothetical protein C0992_004254 [Termitomyces sp. T32_za158]|nr:hypothetical protein C0992_004254 [Termitomyces sp. T32_za158]